MIRVRILLLAASVAITLMPGSARSAAWPDRPLRLVVPFTAGSSSDTAARIVTAKMGTNLGQMIIIENRPGGSTIIGTDVVAKSMPDGYTLGLANATTHAASAVLSPKLPFDPLKDFVPIGMIGRSPFVLVASLTVGASTTSELISLAKRKPDALSYASAGTGTLAHLAGELFKRRAEVEVMHVSYRGTEQSTLDLMQGRIDLSVSTIPPTLQHIRSGKLRALAVMSDHRNPMLPDVPTMAEAGVSGCEAELWTAIVVPSGVPAEIVNRLNSALNFAVNDPTVLEALKIQGIEPQPGPPETVTAAITSDLRKWREVATTAKIGKNN